MSRRVTFLIDEHGKILKTFQTVRPDLHPQEILDALKGKL
jgi:peroxiredoxin